MDRQRLARPILIVGAVITVAASAFAVGSAISSSDDGSESGSGGAATTAAGSTTTAAAGGQSTTTAAAGAATTAAPATATARVEVEIVGFQFGPQDVTVQAGTEVVWTNGDSADHSIISTGGEFQNSETMAQGDSYSFVFTTPGTYEYFCGFHNSMTGTIVVEG